MRKTAALLIGLAIAFMLGYVYMKFNGMFSGSEAVMVAPTPDNTSSGSNSIVYAIVIFSWVTTLLPMPNWLAIGLDMLIGWVGLAVFLVTGVFVWLAQPSNTLQDTTYVAFLCSIAMVASRLARIFRAIARDEDS